MIAYEYNPLLADEFRLLKLLPDQGNDILRAALHNVSFHEPAVQRYTAFSYCWKLDVRHRDLTFDGTVLKITSGTVCGPRFGSRLRGPIHNLCKMI